MKLLAITANLKYSKIFVYDSFSLKKSKTLYSGHLLIVENFSGTVTQTQLTQFLEKNINYYIVCINLLFFV